MFRVVPNSIRAFSSAVKAQSNATGFIHGMPVGMTFGKTTKQYAAAGAFVPVSLKTHYGESTTINLAFVTDIIVEEETFDKKERWKAELEYIDGQSRIWTAEKREELPKFILDLVNNTQV